MSSDTRWDQYEQGFSLSQISFTSQQFLDKPDQEDCAANAGQQEQDVSQFLRGLPRLPSIQSITSQQDTHFFGSLPAIQSIPHPGIVGKNCYDCSKVEATYQTLKSRLACVAFAPDKHAIIDHDSKVVVLKKLMALLDKMHRRCRGSFGLALRYGSFFTLGEQTWFVFVSKGAQYFHKWHQVFLGLEAANIKVYYQRGETFKNSMNSVAEMFPCVSIEELLTNQHRVAIDDLVSETADMQLSSSSNSKKKKKRSRGDEASSSPSPVKKGKGKQTAAKASKMLSSSPEKRTPLRPLQNQQADAETSDGPSCIQSLDFNVDKLFDPPSAASVPAKVQTPLDELANCCVQFLSSASLENCAQHEAQLRRYLEVPQHRGQMGLFLLDGRLNELYVQAAYLKEFVFKIMKDRYEMEPFTLSASDVHSCRAYSFCDMDFKQALARVTDFYDGLKSLVTFALHDRVSVLVYLSFYVLRCHRENKDRRDGKHFSIGSNFLSSEAAILGEIPWAYSKMVVVLQYFIQSQIESSPIDEDQVSHWMPPPDSSHMSVLEAYARDLPSEFLIKTCPNVTRRAFRVNKFKGLMAENQRHFKIAEYGVPVTVWNDVQEFMAHFNRMRVSDREFLMLPSTRYSLMPDSHSTSYEDTLHLTAAMRSSKLVAT